MVFKVVFVYLNSFLTFRETENLNLLLFSDSPDHLPPERFPNPGHLDPPKRLPPDHRHPEASHREDQAAAIPAHSPRLRRRETVRSLSVRLQVVCAGDIYHRHR